MVEHDKFNLWINLLPVYNIILVRTLSEERSFLNYLFNYNFSYTCSIPSFLCYVELKIIFRTHVSQVLTNLMHYFTCLTSYRPTGKRINLPLKFPRCNFCRFLSRLKLIFKSIITQ